MKKSIEEDLLITLSIILAVLAYSLLIFYNPCVYIKVYFIGFPLLNTFFIIVVLNALLGICIINFYINIKSIKSMYGRIGNVEAEVKHQFFISVMELIFFSVYLFLFFWFFHYSKTEIELRLGIEQYLGIFIPKNAVIIYSAIMFLNLSSIMVFTVFKKKSLCIITLAWIILFGRLFTQCIYY